jgi:hypothetical protein
MKLEALVYGCRNIVTLIIYESGTLAFSCNEAGIQHFAGPKRGYESFPLSEKPSFDQKQLG